MRNVVGTLLLNLQIERRLVPVLPCRLSSLQSTQRADFEAAAHVRRGLTLRWVNQTHGSGVALLDSPHLKQYQTVFDTRLAAVKSFAALQARANGVLDWHRRGL
jgi:hypothetical protein